MRPAATPERTFSSQLRGRPGQAGRNSRRLPPSPWRSTAPKRGACSCRKSRPNSPRRRCRPASRRSRRQVPAEPEGSERMLQLKHVPSVASGGPDGLPMPLFFVLYPQRMLRMPRSAAWKLIAAKKRQTGAIIAPVCRFSTMYYMVFRLATSSAYFFRSSAGIGIIPLSAR